MAYLSAIAFALAVVRFIAWLLGTVWGKEARLDAKLAWLAKEQALAKAERDRLKGLYDRIDEQPPPDDPAEALNDAWRKRPKP